MNGQAMTINGKTFEVNSRYEIAGKTYEVYNTMPGLGLVAFCKIGKKGQRTNDHMSMSIEQISALMPMGVIK